MIKYLLEIRNRLFLLLFTWVSTLLICYLYKETLLFLLVQPNRLIASNSSITLYFIFTNVTEIFSFYIQLITFLCFQIFFLHLVYHCFTFLNLAMFKIEAYHFKTFLKFSLGVWACSIILTHFLLVPISWNFFLSFQDLLSSKFIKLHFEAKVNEFISFYILIYYLCVFYCQVFTILFFFLNYVKNKTKVIRKFRKIYYYFFVIFSTLVSPPDIFSQIFISVLIILAYELLVISFLVKAKLNLRQPVKTD